MTTAVSPIAKHMNVRLKLRVSFAEFTGYTKASQSSALKSYSLIDILDRGSGWHMLAQPF